ncbi:MAG: DUF2027 domain-containing protein [Bacteroidales bacterium]|jgi:hypothetical protein|nr:DUF2027 domain-containing protein [Bacteroidales bacterium]
MAEFKIGDKVNFLSAVGGGKVTKIIDSRMVMVEVEDGFEIPTLISDLVLDYRTMPAPSKQQEKVDKVQKEIQGQELLKQQQAEAARKGSLRRFAKEAEKEGIYMSFVPHEQQWILTGPLDVMLVNHTPYEMLYTFTIKEDDKFVNVDYGQIDKYEKIVIETISRDDLECWLNGVVQAILTAETSDSVLHPLNAPFSLRVGRFMKEGSYLPSGILGEKAVTVCLSELIALKHSDGDFTRIMKEGMGAQAPAKSLVKQEAPIDKHRTGPGEAIVDLHIGELVDNILGMSSHDMFKIQIDYFKKMLDSAIAAEYNKVTFIHGVGNGVLKNAIIEALKDYHNTENRMASIAKFGVGAIDVIITEKEK